MRDRGHTLLRDLWWFQGGAARAAERRGAQLLHSPVPSRGGSTHAPVVTTVFDLAVLRHPEKFRPWLRNYARVAMPGMIRSARAVLTLSEASRAEIIEVLGIDPARVTVVPCGVSPEFVPRAEHIDADDRALLAPLRIEGPFVLTVGAVEPRKNLDGLLRAMAVLRARSPYRDLQLVHVGPEGWLSGNLPQLVNDLGLGDSVRFLGMLPRAALAALYRAARVMVYPSLYEGFGLPIAEAMASGTPVVTSNCSSMPEVAGDAGILIDPTSVEAIAEGIARAWSDEALRAGMMRAGLVQARQFTWDAAARQTAAVYDEVLAEPAA
jgi:glycosyltransferase involved in cell wall biosynthesis